MIHLEVKNYGVVGYEVFRNGALIEIYEEPTFNGPKYRYIDPVQKSLDKDFERYEKELERLRNNN